MSDDELISHLFALASRLMRFMESHDYADIKDVFASQDVALIDSFHPYEFAGANAVSRWAEGFIQHSRNITNLRHQFGAPQEYSRNGALAFLSLPLSWQGQVNGSSFHEAGGLALVFVQTGPDWKIKNYGWAATSFRDERGER